MANAQRKCVLIHIRKGTVSHGKEDPCNVQVSECIKFINKDSTQAYLIHIEDANGNSDPPLALKKKGTATWNPHGKDLDQFTYTIDPDPPSGRKKIGPSHVIIIHGGRKTPSRKRTKAKKKAHTIIIHSGNQPS